MGRSGVIACIGIILAVAAQPARAAGASTAGLAAHKAVYDIQLDRSVSGGVIAASGSSVYRVQRVCSGWTMEDKTSLTLSYDGEDDYRQVWSLATWESADGTDFRGRGIEYLPDGTKDRVATHAHIGPDGGQAVYTEPNSVTRALPADARFGVGHIADVLATAKAGGRQVMRVVFDGGNSDNPYTVNAVILGPADPVEGARLAKRFHLAAVPAWRIHMAYFPFGDNNGEPDFEVEGTYRADGIAYDVVQDFGSFRLRLNLKDVTLLKKPHC